MEALIKPYCNLKFGQNFEQLEIESTHYSSKNPQSLASRINRVQPKYPVDVSSFDYHLNLVHKYLSFFLPTKFKTKKLDG